MEFIQVPSCVLPPVLSPGSKNCARASTASELESTTQKVMPRSLPSFSVSSGEPSQEAHMGTTPFIKNST